jgi:hypothetical protein
MNLILAAVWLVLGVILLTLPLVDPEQRLVPLGRSGYLAGGMALVLVVYNLVRWWSSKAFAADREAARQSLTRRRHHEEEDPARPQPERDPNFDFTDRPPP